jgi:hypothetical protein
MNEKDEYLSYINNDLLIFVGYFVDLKKKNDIEGQQLWKEMDKKMYENNELSEEKIIAVLKMVPLYFLMAFLGYATYKELIKYIFEKEVRTRLP